MIPNKPYPPRASEKSCLFSPRLHRTIVPSAFMRRNESTVEAMGGRPYCQPWQLTLSDPPTENELSDCITSIERPRLSRYGMISDHWDPACTWRMFFPSSSSMRLNGNMLIVIPPG